MLVFILVIPHTTIATLFATSIRIRVEKSMKTRRKKWEVKQVVDIQCEERK
jgi:hypothetical protein